MNDVPSCFIRLALMLAIPFATTVSSSLTSERVNPDFAIRTTYDITVKRADEDQYTTVVKKFNEFTYLSERSTQVNRFTVHESSVGTISRLQATFNKRELSDERFSFEMAPSEDVFLSGTKRHYIYIPADIKKGDVFSYSYKEEYRDIVFFPLLYIPSNDSISLFKATYHLPDDADIDFHFFFSSDSFPVSIERNGKGTVTLTAETLPERSEIPFFSYNGTYAIILATIRKDSVNITPTSLQQLVQWYSKKASLLPDIDSTDIPQALTFIDTAGTPYQRIRSISDFIRKNIRYIADERGLNAYIARPPSLTLKKKYGDCKDKASLGVALSRLNNTTVYMALVSTTPIPEFEQAHVYLYNHVICAYVIDGKINFFDPTSSTVEFGNIPEQLIGARALILDPNNPRYETIHSPRTQPSLDITINAHLDSLANADAVIVLRNNFAATARYALRELTVDRWKQYMQEVVSSNLFQLRLNDFRFVSEDEGSMTIHASAELSKFAVVSPPRTYMPRTPFTGPFNDIAAREHDSLPIFLSSESRLRLQINIQAPQGSIDTSQRFTLGNTNSSWWYTAFAAQKGDMISFRYEFSAVPRNITANEKKIYLPFIKQYLSNKKNRFIITKRS